MYTVNEIAARLKCSRAFVYGLLKSGKLRHHKLGTGQGGRRISEEQLAAYLESTEQGTPPAAKEAAKPAPRAKKIVLDHLHL